jgi:hypothetical protein
MLERDRTPYPGAPVEEMLGTHFLNSSSDDGGTYAEDKMNASVHWTLGNLSVGYLAEYIGSIDATATFQSTYNQHIDSQLYHDLVFDYTLDVVGETMLTVGFTNLTNEEPPYIDRAFNASTDPSTYRMFGRGYFFRVSQTF